MKKSHIHHKRVGFTLLEMLVAVVVLGGISIVVSQVFFASTRGSIKHEISTDIKQTGDAAIVAMDQLIRNSAGIVSSCNPGGVTSQTLQILGQDGQITTFGCVQDNPNKVTRIASTSASVAYLTPNTITVGGTRCTDAEMSLLFTCTSHPIRPPIVQISFTLSENSKAQFQYEKSSISFQTTVGIRNQ